MTIHKRRHAMRATPSFSLRRSLLAGVTLACLAQLQAQAQSTPATAPAPAPAPAADAAATLDAVTVTATRREEPLQKVPVAVSVLDGQYLEQNSRNGLQSIAAEVPTVNFRAGASNKDTSLFVRGVGTVTTSSGVEPTVSTVIDGVVLGRPGQATLDLLDIERVEVLRGPQGTLFGRNASAGVVNIVTRAPSSETTGYVDVLGSSDGESRLRAGVSGTLVPDTLRGNVTALFGDFDGNGRNVHTDEDVNGYRNYGVRGKLEYTPNADFRLTLGADYLHAESTTPTGFVTRSVSPAFAAELLPVLAGPENRSIDSDVDGGVTDINQGLSLTAEWFLPKHTLTSITAWRGWDNTQTQDGDRLSRPTPAFAGIADRGEVDTRQFSQELRIHSTDSGFFDYVAGLYFLRGSNDEIYQRTSTWYDGRVGGYAIDHGRADFSTRNTSYSAFGEGTFNFTDSLRAIAGLRVTRDELSYDHRRVSTVPSGIRNAIRSPYASAGSTRETGYSGRIGPQLDLSENVSTYLTYSRGYKGPAYNVYFNMQGIDTPVLDPETSDAYEIGLKSTAFDDRLRLNLAAFYTRYDNFQSNFRSIDPTSGFAVSRLVNAGEVSTRGIELDLNARPTRNLTLSAALARIDARIDNFSCPPGDSACPDVNGKPLPYAPDWKANVQVERRIPLASGRHIELGTQYNWQSETQYDISQSPATIQPAYGIWNASIALVSPASGWRVALLARNIGDKAYASWLGTGGGYVNRQLPRDDERYFGLNLRQDF